MNLLCYSSGSVRLLLSIPEPPNPVLMVEAPGLEPSKISAPEKLKVFLDPPNYPLIYPKYPRIKDHKGSIEGPLGGPGSSHHGLR